MDGKERARLWGGKPTEVCFVTEKHEVCVTTVELTSWFDQCYSKYPPTLQGFNRTINCLKYLLSKTLGNKAEKWRLNPTSGLCPILNPHDLLDWIENMRSSMSLAQYVENKFMTLVEHRRVRKYKYKPLRDGTNSYDHSYTTDDMYLYAGRRRGRGKKTIKRKRNIMSRRSKTGRKSRRSRRA